LPLLLRAGYLVPLLDPTIDTLAEEHDPNIVSPADVAEVYDVIGLLTPGEGGDATFTLYDGGTLRATWSGGFAAPSLKNVPTDQQLATCTGCYRTTTLAPNLERVQISLPDGVTVAGGLTLSSKTGRRVRWDLYLVTPAVASTTP
jgi:hypothetical protein